MAKQPKPAHTLPPDLVLEDFYAYMPANNEYLLAITGELWPGSSVSKRLPRVPLLHPDGTPVLITKGKNKGEPKVITAAEWLGLNRRVDQMTWAPGEAQLISNKMADRGGWIDRPGVMLFNLYRPPTIRPGNAANAGPWLDLVDYVYPKHIDHALGFMGHCVQHPGVKINHALVMTGSQGIGKDTILEPLKYGVGPHNFSDVSPISICGTYNGYMRATVIRVSESRDLGEVNRYKMYETMKTIIATPPDMVEINIKRIAQHFIPNVANVVMTTNYATDGIYLPPDDRRHYVCGTEKTKEDFWEDYWPEIWGFYAAGGLADVVAYLQAYDLSKFNPKAPPEKTAAFWRMADAGVASEVPELRDALDRLATIENGVPVLPIVTTTAKVMETLRSGDLYEWLKDRKNRRSIPHRFESCGYLALRNNDRADGLWSIFGKRHTLYGRQDVTVEERQKAAETFVAEEEKRIVASQGKVLHFPPPKT